MTVTSTAPQQTAPTQALKPVTRELAHWAARLRYQDLPPEVIHQVKRLTLDYYCAVIAGSTTPTSRAAQAYFGSAEGAGNASVVGTPVKLSTHSAAFVNGTAAHGLELDDGYTPGSYHPGAACMPAIMAVAQAYKSKPEDVVNAIVIGFELSCRMARAGHPHTWQNGFHNTGVNGVFGCASGVGKLLDLSELQMTWALGMAGSFSSGLFEFLGEGSEIKRLHPGKCARDGVVVAEMAKHGVDGPLTGIEGKNGYFKAYAGGKADPMSTLDELGQTWELLMTYVKPYPCCRHLHAPIDAILDLKKTHKLDPSQIESILVQTNQVAAKHAHTHYAAFLDAQMSIPFAVATAIVHDEIGLDAFGRTARARADIAGLVPKVKVEISEQMQAVYPMQRPAHVIVQMKDGSRLELTQRQPYGEPDNPLDDEALTGKFHAVCDAIIGKELADKIVQACWNLNFEEIFALTAMQPEQVKDAAL